MLSDNESLESIKPSIEFLTPELGAELFFNMIISEMYYENGEVSPFKSLNLKDAVEYYVNTVRKDDVLSQNEALNSKVNDFVTILRDRYELELELN